MLEKSTSNKADYEIALTDIGSPVELTRTETEMLMRNRERQVKHQLVGRMAELSRKLQSTSFGGFGGLGGF